MRSHFTVFEINPSSSNLGIYATCLTIVLYLSRTAIPVLKYLFIPLYISIIIYAILINRRKLFSKLIIFSKSFWIFLVLFGILSLSFVFSDKIYLVIFKDICNTFILLSLFYLMFTLTKERNELNFFSSSLISLFIIFAAIISITGIAAFLRIIEVDSIFSSDHNSESLPTDANFSLLIIFFGMISLIVFLRKIHSKRKILIGDFILVLCTLYIFLSGSRRGLGVLLILVFFFIFNCIVSCIKSKSIKGSQLFGLVSYLSMILILMISIWIITDFTSHTFKTNSLKFIKSRNPDLVKIDVASSLHKYLSIFNKSIEYEDIYKRIWTPKLNPYDPDSGWGTRPHTTIFPIYGQDYAIVPTGSKGYLMDKHCSSDSRSGNAYSYTAIFNSEVTGQKILEASVFCFVSEDFNGEWALISTEGAIVGKKECEYDLSQKGKWQKLSLRVNCLNGIANVYLYFSKFGVTDFSSLTGYVIYAYPLVSIIDKDNYSESSETQQNNKEIYKVQSFVNSDLIQSFNFFVTIFKQNESSNDPIRQWVNNLVSEDTTYHKYSTDLRVDTLDLNFMSDRVKRWKLALQIFKYEFSYSEKLIGGGFNFLNWYGKIFIKDKTASDWPHNPFLSILLYSGIVGLLLYLILLYKVFHYYIKYRKEYFIFFIFFLITFFFSFFSGSSPFDPPIMGFFIMLPFFIHSIHKRADEHNNIKNLTDESIDNG